MSPVRCSTLLVAIAMCSLDCAVAGAAANPSQVQFDGECAEGLAEGQHVATNCAITWTDKDGKVYCFSSEAAKKTFLQDPNGKLLKQ